MKTCPHCRIQVGGDGLYCPLCHTPLAGAADPGGEAPYFPPSPPPGRRAPFGLQLAAFVLLGGSAACLAVDFLLQDGVHLHWSLAVLAAAVAALCLLRALLLGSRNAPKLLFQILVGASALVFFCDKFFGLGDVSVEWIIPVLCSVTLLLNFLFSFINRRFTENGLIYLLLNMAVGIAPYLAFSLLGSRTPIAWGVCLVISIVTFIGLVIFRGRDMRGEFERRFHL